MPLGYLGAFNRDTNVIRLERRMLSRQYRCILRHEWEHWLAQHRMTGDRHADAAMEAEASQRAARALIDIRDLGEVAAAYPDDPHRVAWELNVMPEVLQTRVQHLHPSERAFLRRRLAHTEESA